jgi:hypothetical protein
MISQRDAEEVGREPAARPGPVSGVSRSDRSSWTARREAPPYDMDSDLAGNHDTATRVQVPEAAPGSRGPPAARAGRAAAGVLLGYY